MQLSVLKLGRSLQQPGEALFGEQVSPKSKPDSLAIPSPPPLNLDYRAIEETKSIKKGETVQE